MNFSFVLLNMNLTQDNNTLVFVLMSPNWTDSWWILIIGNWEVTVPSAGDDIQLNRQMIFFLICVLITQFIFTNVSCVYILFSDGLLVADVTLHVQPAMLHRYNTECCCHIPAGCDGHMD